jgi:hypothetical protein
MKRHLAVLVGLVVVAALALDSAVATPARPGVFTANVTNPWFPLRPGTTYVYTGVKDGKPSRDVLRVTHRTAVIDGAPCVVIDDRLYLAGHLGERTTDWYTQDSRGNVWYFGESTAELDARGHVTSTTGSWRAGVHGARPGIFVPAQPRVGESARQEYFRGQAEDHFQVIGVASAEVLLTREWTPLEPAVLDHKLYVRGIGMVLEQSVAGPTERGELVRVLRG